MTAIKLKPDSIFEYRYWGDMAFDTAIAYFHVADKKIFLTYFPVNVDSPQGQWIQRVKYGESAPSQLIIRNKKLFLVDMNGRKVKSKKDRFNKNRKYYLIKK